jgi:3-carboxy-cis,cis-muconate cycloisomerase
MFDELFRDSDIEALLTDEAIIRAMLRFEAALALAQADAGVIPSDQAGLIARVCEEARIDHQKIIAAAKKAGNPAIPLVKELTAQVRETAGEAARYVHVGATSQDVIDSAVMLQVKAALLLLDRGVDRLQNQLVELVREHRATVMIGRTLLQQARPISFGFKAAGWLDQLIRCRQTLRRAHTSATALQFGGAVGTLAASGDRGLVVLTRLAERLELAEPVITWHTARDRLLEVAAGLAMLGGCLSKIATDAALLMQTEVAELLEASEEGKGGSSAMPHKRNPIAPTMIIAACTRVPGLLATMAASMVQEHERAMGHWHAEWGPLAEMLCLTGGAVQQANALFSGVKVDAARMRENMDATRGLIYAEDVSVALAQHVGKPEADRIVKLACERAMQKKLHLCEVLLQEPIVAKFLDQTAMNWVFLPENALGFADQLIDRVLRVASQQSDPENQHA